MQQRKFWGNQKPDINKTLSKAIMKKSQLKGKANKTWNKTCFKLEKVKKLHRKTEESI